MTTQTEKDSKKYYDKLSLKVPENYERYFVPVIGKPVAEDLIRLAALRPNEKVLDVGCGTGVAARIAAQQVGKNGSVTGLDVNPGMLAVARSITDPDMSIEWIEASAEKMPLPEEVFDIVLCPLSFQFIEDKAAALKEMKRVLVSGGRLILNVPGQIGEIFAVFAEGLENNISSKAAGFVKQVFALHDPQELQQLMLNANFNDIDIQQATKPLQLPEPKKFLWQYIHSTPLVEVVSQLNKEARDILEREIVNKWQKFVKNGSMKYQQQIISASARK